MSDMADYRRTLANLITDTRALLDDPNGERYTALRVVDALNQAMVDFCLRTQLLQETITVQLLEDTTEYDIKALVAADDTLREYGFPVRLGFNGSDASGVWPSSLLRIDRRGYSRLDYMRPAFWYLCATDPGGLTILGLPQEDGSALPAATNNLQVTYVALPASMAQEQEGGADLLLWWRCEGDTLTDELDYSEGATELSYEADTVSGIAERAKVLGTYGWAGTPDNYGSYFDVSDYDIVHSDEGRIGMWVNVQDATMPFFWSLQSVDGVEWLSLAWCDQSFAAFQGPMDEIGETDVAVTTGLHAADEWRFVEVAWSIADQYLRIYIGGIQIAEATGITLVAPTNPLLMVLLNQYVMGCGAEVGDNFWIDQLMISGTATDDLYALRNEVSYPGSGGEEVEGVEMDSEIPAVFQTAMPYRAAMLLLENGGLEGLTRAERLGTEYERLVGDAVAERYRANTPYEDMVPQ